MNAVASPVIHLTPCESSQLAAYGYDADSQTLAIRFKPTSGAPQGSVYHYFDVAPDVFGAMKKAPSVGTFFGKELRGKFKYEKQPEEPGGIVFGLSQKQEPKYTTATASGRVVNRATGKPIGDDEPIMIFRAQDKNVVPMLWAYYDTCVNADHRAVIKSRIADFERFATEHPDRMKEPDSNLRELASANLIGTPATPVVLAT